MIVMLEYSFYILINIICWPSLWPGQLKNCSSRIYLYINFRRKGKKDEFEIDSCHFICYFYDIRVKIVTGWVQIRHGA